jgi:2',3'-cyclic-nucleotide 2'-phosphodiesterase (5'-nucleotidase family)
LTKRAIIFHTNDFHNHLKPEQVIRLKALRAELGSEGLLLDAGDAISAGNVTYHAGGEPILTTMSEIGYDAMTVGNREFHLSQSGFHAKLSNASFPILCANVRSQGESPLPVVPYITRTVRSGLRIIVFGLTVPMITERMLVRKISSYVFDDPIAVASDIAPALRPECDLLVCLSHVGVAKDRELAASVNGIDLIIGGHTHVTLPEGERVGESLIVQAGWWGHSLGTVLVTEEQGRLSLSATIETL